MNELHRVLVSVLVVQEWSVTFVRTDTNIRIGPWLLFDTHDEVRTILAWGEPSSEEMEEHEDSIRRWSVSGVVWWLTEAKLAQLIERGRGWPWTGYELRKMKAAGKYPPTRRLSSLQSP